MFKFIYEELMDMPGYRVVYEGRTSTIRYDWYSTKQEAIDELTIMLKQLTEQL